MCNNSKDGDLKVSSRAYAEAKENFIKCVSVPMLEKTKRKISEANTGKIRTEKMKLHMSEVKKENPPVH